MHIIGLSSLVSVCMLAGFCLQDYGLIIVRIFVSNTEISLVTKCSLVMSSGHG